MVGATSSANGTSGLVPAPSSGNQGKYLRGDGTWQTPTNTTYAVFIGSGSSAASGLVPKPSTTAGTTKYLREDATWQVPPDTNTVYTHPTTSGNKHIPSGGSSGQFLKWSADGTAVWAADNNTTYSNFKASGDSAAAGLVPSPGTTAGTTKYLREDATWQVPPDTNTDTHYTSHLYAGTSSGNANAATTNGNTYLIICDNTTARDRRKIAGSGATSVTSDASGNITISSTNTTYSNFVKSGSTAAAGLVPSPGTTAGTTKYLREDATWQVPPNTVYTHPTSAGNKHIPSGGSSGQILRWSADGTAAWGADNNTTYSTFVKSGSSAAAGLVPSPGTTAGTTKYLREDATWQVPPDTNTVYTHPTTAGNKHIPSGGASGQSLVYSSAGTAAWGYPQKIATEAGTTNAARHVFFAYAGDDNKVVYNDKFQYNPSTDSLTVGSINGYTIAKSVPSNAVFTDTVYTHPTTAGNKHIPSGGSSGQFLKYSAAGTAAWAADNNTTYSNMTGATSSTAGTAGLVPAPAKGYQARYLRGDGTWQAATDFISRFLISSGSGVGRFMAASSATSLAAGSWLLFGIKYTNTGEDTTGTTYAGYHTLSASTTVNGLSGFGSGTDFNGWAWRYA